MSSTIRARVAAAHPWRAGRVLTCALLAAAWGCSDSLDNVAARGAAEQSSPPPRSVQVGRLTGADCLIVVLDALHACHLGCYGETRPTSPAIDGLAADGVRFTRAWSQTSWTLPSTACLMTGLYQEAHGVMTPEQVLGEDADTLAEAFARAGYATVAFTQNPYASAAFGLDQGFGKMELLPGTDADATPGEACVDARVADAVLAALAPRVAGGAAAARGPPRFVYAHFRRPHMPYAAPPAQRAQFADAA